MSTPVSAQHHICDPKNLGFAASDAGATGPGIFYVDAEGNAHVPWEARKDFAGMADEGLRRLAGYDPLDWISIKTRYPKQIGKLIEKWDDPCDLIIPGDFDKNFPFDWSKWSISTPPRAPDADPAPVSQTLPAPSSSKAAREVNLRLPPADSDPPFASAADKQRAREYFWEIFGTPSHPRPPYSRRQACQYQALINVVARHKDSDAVKALGFDEHDLEIATAVTCNGVDGALGAQSHRPAPKLGERLATPGESLFERLRAFARALETSVS